MLGPVMTCMRWLRVELAVVGDEAACRARSRPGAPATTGWRPGLDLDAGVLATNCGAHQSSVSARSARRAQRVQCGQGLRQRG